MRHSLRLVFAFLLLLLSVPSVASAQDAPSTLTPISSGEVKIELESFGVGNVARAGDWCGIRMKVQDTGTKARDLIIRIAGLDYDGDTPLYQREIASNPGSWQSVWVYVRLPFNYNPSSGLTAFAYEGQPVETRGPDAPTGFRAGRLLGYAEIRVAGGPSGIVRDSSFGLIAIMGNRPLGLRAYSTVSNTGRTSQVAHEVTDVIVGINPTMMPDRWIGLLPFDSFVWAQGSPAELREPRSAALRQYVEHGGHLIIIVPSVGQTFTDERSNDLIDIMPTVSMSRREVNDFDRYRPLISREPLPQNRLTSPPFPNKAIIHAFTPVPDAKPSDAIRVLDGPDGECLVVRRLVGAGSVTLVGLDLNQTALSQFDLIDADMFWHRVLGKRGDYAAKPTVASTFGRKQTFLDRDIRDVISQERGAAKGVLVGFVVFVLYWLIAAPVGFLVLKRFNLTQHSWVAFVGAAAIFTAISWTGANLLRDREVYATHLTILDHVYGQPLQRAKMWASISVPWYGTANISVGKPQETSEGEQIINTIASWDDPGADASSWGGFPDVRGYIVDTRQPDNIRVPVRATVKQVEAIWAGGPAWEMPRPARPEEGGTGKIELQDQTLRSDGSRSSLLEGKLLHNLPGPLNKVLVVVIRRQVPVRSSPFAGPICIGNVYTVTAPWDPNVPLDLKVITQPTTQGVNTNTPEAKSQDFGTFLNSRYKLESESDGNDIFARLNALALFPQLPTPEGSDTNKLAAQRPATHGLDLGIWFTQPCVIVLGHMGAVDRADAPSPVPLMVDGQQIPNTGRTAVRWVYPLPDDPPSLPTSSDSASEAAPSEAPKDPT